MKISAGEFERSIKETGEQLTRERGASAAATSELAEARSKLEGLNARTADLEKQLAAQTGTAEALNKRVAELEGNLTDQGQRFAAHQQENQRLRSESEAVATATSNVADKFEAEVDHLEAQLVSATAEQTKLRAEIARLQQDAEATTLVRDRVNTVAAEVARLTAALEGPSSPIATLIANGISHRANGSGASGKADSAGEQKGTLADRIRALQSSATRQV